MNNFRLAPKRSELKYLEGIYINPSKEHDKKMLAIEYQIIAQSQEIKDRGYLNLNELRKVAQWKSPRRKEKVKENKNRFVEEVTKLALSSETDEQLRIEILTLLKGISWPTASVILHLYHNEPYPIMDFRALGTLCITREEIPTYNFEFWNKYVIYCREIAQAESISMRALDRALWQYSAQP